MRKKKRASHGLWQVPLIDIFIAYKNINIYIYIGALLAMLLVAINNPSSSNASTIMP